MDDSWRQGDEHQVVHAARERMRGVATTAGWTLRAALDLLALAHAQARNAGPVIAEHCVDPDASMVVRDIAVLTESDSASVQAVRALSDYLLADARQLSIGGPPESVPTGDVERRIRRVATVARSLEHELRELYGEAQALDPDAGIGPDDMPAAMVAALAGPESGLADALRIVRLAAMAAVPEAA